MGKMQYALYNAQIHRKLSTVGLICGILFMVIAPICAMGGYPLLGAILGALALAAIVTAIVAKLRLGRAGTAPERVQKAKRLGTLSAVASVCMVAVLSFSLLFSVLSPGGGAQQPSSSKTSIFAGLFGPKVDYDAVYASVETALNEYDEYPMVWEDIAGQLETQKSAQDLKQEPLALQYDVVVQLADMQALDISGVAYTPAEVDIANLPDVEKIKSAAREEAMPKLAELLKTAQQYDMKITLRATCSQQADGWVCWIDDSGYATIAEYYEGALEEAWQKVWENDPTTDIIALASMKDELAAAIFNTPQQYNSYVKLIDIKKAGDGYDITLQYPDAEKMLTVLANQYYATYSKVIFNERSAEAFSGAVSDYPSAIEQSGADNSAVLHLTVTGGRPSGGSFTYKLANTANDGTSVGNLYSNAQKTVGEALNTKINNNWLVTAKSRPSTGYLAGSSGSVSITFETMSGYGDYYVALYKVGGANATGQGTLYSSGYVRDGGKLTLYASPGYYKIYVGQGSTWYGTKYMFGPNGDYLLFDSVEGIDSGYAYTYTLYAVSGGSIGTVDAPYPY